MEVAAAAAARKLTHCVVAWLFGAAASTQGGCSSVSSRSRSRRSKSVSSGSTSSSCVKNASLVCTPHAAVACTWLSLWFSSRMSSSSSMFVLCLLLLGSTGCCGFQTQSVRCSGVVLVVERVAHLESPAATVSSSSVHRGQRLVHGWAGGWWVGHIRSGQGVVVQRVVVYCVISSLCAREASIVDRNRG